MDYLGLIPLFVSGLVMIIKSEYLQEVEYISAVDGVGPTGPYSTFIRISGILFMVCSVAAAPYVLLPQK